MTGGPGGVDMVGSTPGALACMTVQGALVVAAYFEGAMELNLQLMAVFVFVLVSGVRLVGIGCECLVLGVQAVARQGGGRRILSLASVMDI
jgi:hypothetical protein